MSALNRRAVVITVATLVLFATAATAAHTVGETTVKSGRWQGITWRLKAQAGSDGSYCIAMIVARREAGRSCGSIRSEGISYLAHTGRPAPDYVVGPVTARARFVQIEFFERPPLRIPAVRPPAALDRSTRFFVAILPCPATPKSFVAAVPRDGSSLKSSSRTV